MRDPKPTTPAEPASARAQRLFAAAREAAREQLEVLTVSLGGVSSLAAQVADGGEAYPPAIRDLCRRMSDETDRRSLALTALSERLFVEDRRG